MFGSKNKFFLQNFRVLDVHREKAEILLDIKGRGLCDIRKYLKAFDYFCKNPLDYDGATIVKDLVDLRHGEYYLDLDAMLHDYDYIMGANLSLKNKYTADRCYIRNMELNGKGIRIVRLIGLTISGIILVPYWNLTKKLKNG